MTTSNAEAYDLIPLTTLEESLQMAVRTIRNEEEVRRWMFTDHIITEAEHRQWIERLKTDDRQIVFVVLDPERTPLGVVSVNTIDRRHRKAEWAFYLSASAQGGLGSALENAFIRFLFDTLDIDKLNGEVLDGNEPVLRLHQRFLFQEEGLRRSNILKDGKRMDVRLLGLTREDWEAGREMIDRQYGPLLERFAIQIHWPTDTPAT